MLPYVDIHTHRPTLRAIELRTAGIHPWDAETGRIETLLPTLANAQAIGEIGLDKLRGPAADIQLTLLREQLELAQRHDLPVVLHCVRSFEPLMRELLHFRLRAVIFHGFIGSEQQALQAVARGYYLSFGIRSLRSARTVRALGATPCERLFLETDDDPTPIEEVYARAAEVLGTTIETLQQTTLANYRRIFGASEQKNKKH